MYHSHRVRRRAMAATLAAMLVISVCGDDDKKADSTTTPSTSAASSSAASTTAASTPSRSAAPATVVSTTTAASATTATAPVDLDAFCQAEMKAEAAAVTNDPSQMGPAFDAVIEAAPDDIRPTVEAVVAAASSGAEDFDEQYAKMIDYVADNCGFPEITVTGTDYSFAGFPTEVAKGGTVINFVNKGTEAHEVLISRINDGVTATVKELLELPEEEAMAKLTMVGGSFALPDASRRSTVDLTPGRYVAVCFLPVGATPEVVMQMDGPEASPPPGVKLGPPHAMVGMTAEFTVKG